MTNKESFPSISPTTAADVAQACAHFSVNYDVIVSRSVSERGNKEYLGSKPRVCRFCSTTSSSKFKKDAHAIPELTGNGILLSHYECDDCNDRFSAFEDDLGKLTLVSRLASQVEGKNGAPSAKGRFKSSRIDLGGDGFNISSYEHDPIFEINEAARTYTIKVAAQSFRPLGVFKALTKSAITLMDESDVKNVQEALCWLRSGDVSSNAVEDGLGYRCIRTFTPGPRPFALTYAWLLRRKSTALVPTYIFVLAFGNESFQIVVPSPKQDIGLHGAKVDIFAFPIFPFLDPKRVKGATRYRHIFLSSGGKEAAPSQVTFHFDRATKGTGESSEEPESA